MACPQKDQRIPQTLNSTVLVPTDEGPHFGLKYVSLLASHFQPNYTISRLVSYHSTIISNIRAMGIIFGYVYLLFTT